MFMFFEKSEKVEVMIAISVVEYVVGAICNLMVLAL